MIKNQEDNFVEDIDIKCGNFHRSTSLYLKDKTVQEMITIFLLNTVFNNVGLSWIISSNNQTKYEIEENNINWLNKGLWYNTSICSKLHGTMFKYFSRNSRIDRYNLICCITANDKQQPTYVDDARSFGGISITKNATTASLEPLIATLSFIDFGLNTLITIIKLDGKCIMKL